ncbi:hypothetical protein [Actinoplanes sp. NPDC049599]|uniref:hypothetical protein n=1 Tax=Actinoplanes sp. NPDC049599 TaxID=3363903 RepID=UPI00378A4858
MADPRLVRAYRRLLLAYPPGPRRAELLDTLVECAPPGRRRPGAREVVNLLRHGARARLGRPRSRGVVVLALLVTLAGGFLGAAAANGLGLAAVGPLPAGAEAAELRETIFPGLPVSGGGDAATIVSQADGEGIEYGYAVSWVRHTAATRDVAGYTAAARARLEAAGWRVTGVDPPLDRTDVVGAHPGDRAEGFTAVRGDLGLSFSDTYWPGQPWYDSDGAGMYFVWHEPPSWLVAVTWAGVLPGALLAWLLTGWASRRLERRPEASLAATVGAGIFLLGLLPVALSASDTTADETAAPFWHGFAGLGILPLLLGGVPAAGILIAALAQGPPGFLRRLRWPRTPRPAAVVALTVVASMLLGLGAYRLVTRHTMPGSCTPSVPAGIVDPPGARLSYLSRIFISPQATDDQRNLVQAAIGRGFGGGLTFDADPTSRTFAEAYCNHGRLADAVAETLPRYWTVDLASPGLFTGLATEVIGMPGVVAAHHVPE